MTPRILIVDDQREVSRLLRSALETIEHGLQVAEAPSGEEALLDSVRNRVDLLVADFRLPGMSGIELMRKMKVRNPDLKVILITGVTDPRAKEEIAKAGADAYFLKPVPMADFLDMVERSLGMVRTILPAAPEVAKEPERKGLADLLSGLRQDLSAQAVILLNERGLIKAQAGELPEASMEVSLISALMAISSAAQKVASLVGSNPSGNVHIFRSEGNDAIFLPVGPLHAVLIAGKGIAAPDKWAGNFGKISVCMEQTLKGLEKIGATGQLSPAVVEAFEAKAAAEKAAAVAAIPERPAAEEPLAEIPSDFEELLFGSAAKPAVDLDSFWDQAAEKGASFVLKDTLSFEEASKLGLAPDAKS